MGSRNQGVIGSGLLAGLMLAGCTQLPPEARKQLLSSNELYAAGRYGEARGQLSALIRGHKDKAEIGEAYYLRGLCEIRLKSRSAGRRDLEEALARSKRTEVRARAAATLGSMAYEDGDYRRAADQLDQAVKHLPSRPPLDELLLRLGTCLQRQGRWRAARSMLGRVIREFAGRPAAAEARRKHDWPFEYFSIQAGAFRSAPNAQKLVSRLRAAGLDASYRLDGRSGANLHAVTVGRYLKWEQADRDLPRVQRVEPTAIIVP